MTNWQPIETAPKDGQIILVARFKGEEFKWASDARWRTAQEIADEWGDSPDEYEPAWVSNDDEDVPLFPTHWQPLEPPMS